MKKTLWTSLIAGLMAMGSLTALAQDVPAAPRAEAAAGAAVDADAGPDQAGLNDRRENPREDRRDDRREARRDDAGAARVGGGAQANANYKFHNGLWWYQTADGWLYWQSGRWNRYQSGAAATTRSYGYSQPRYNSGYYDRGYYDGGYYNQPYTSGYRGYYDGYNNSGYYGRGYGYGRGGYGYGYNYNGPGYGNRGWGNMNYGSRGANQGSNIGGMIDQGLGGSGRAGAAIGGAIGR